MPVMDIVAYTGLGLCGLIAVVWAVWWLVDLLREPLGRAVVLVFVLLAIALWGVVSAVWLIGTKVI